MIALFHKSYLLIPTTKQELDPKAETTSSLVNAGRPALGCVVLVTESGEIYTEGCQLPKETVVRFEKSGSTGVVKHFLANGVVVRALDAHATITTGEHIYAIPPEEGAYVLVEDEATRNAKKPPLPAVLSTNPESFFHQQVEQPQHSEDAE